MKRYSIITTQGEVLKTVDSLEVRPNGVMALTFSDKEEYFSMYNVISWKESPPQNVFPAVAAAPEPLGEPTYEPED